jgi:trk system potassium uptake protein TrkH
MNVPLVLYILSRLSFFLGLLLFVPALVAIGYGDGGRREWLAFLTAAGIAALAGLMGRRFKGAATGTVSPPEGFASVTLGWGFAALIGAIPYWLSGTIGSFTDCFFESVSGFTTTGASILRDIESLPHGILFWRSFTQWLGGMGIVALFVALLPALGAGGNFLFQAEVPGPTTDRIRPRISETAKVLWAIYLSLTLILALLLWFLGMTPFEAICHSFTTLSTGGFSTSNTSLGEFSAAIQWLVTFFMFIAGINFTMHFLVLRRSFRPVVSNAEVRLYTATALLASLLIVLAFVFLDPARPALPGETPGIAIPITLHDKVRHATFNAVSILTTTGFGTHDFDRWPYLSQLLLILLMFAGGCAGSTAGGIKMARLLLMLRYAGREIRRLLHPSAILPIKLGQRSVNENAVHSTAGFFIIFMLLYALGALLLLALGEGPGTALSSVVACLSNIGPGLSSVGPAANYADVSAVGKWLLSAFMLLGRLELYAVLLLFVPGLWRK